MNVKIKLTSDWKGHKAGTVLEVDDATAKEIAAAKAGDAVKEDDKSADEALSAMVEKSVTSAVDKVVGEKLGAALEKAASKKLVHISIHDKSDDDPTFGYLGEHNKSLEQLSPGEVHKAFGLFAKDVHAMGSNSGREPERLMKCRQRVEEMVRKAAGDGMIVNSDEAGGYLIFSAATAMMQAAALENAVVRPLAKKITMTTQLLTVPYLRDNTHSGGTVYGGVAAYWDTELAQYSESKPKLGKLEWKLNKLTALGFVSDEWAKWSPVSMGSWLIPRFGEAVGFKEDLGFLVGTGAGMPRGLLNSPAAISIAAEDGQTSGTFVLENATNMLARLRRKNNGAVRWLMNQTVLPQLPLFNIPVGTGGVAVFTNNVSGAPGQAIWGYPIVYTEKIPALGTAKAEVLADLSDYVVADDQSGPEIAQSIHLKFDYGQQCFRITKYVDGGPETNETFQPVNGSTLSPVITFAHA